MAALDEEKIADAILDWAIGSVRNRNRWTRSPIGRAIKQVVYQSGNWKNAPRGNPSNGFRAESLRVKRPRQDQDRIKFQLYVSKWRQETAGLSLVHQKISNMAYLKIVGMGDAALPYIAEELKQRRRYWFPALEAIAQPKENPIKQGSSFDDAIQSWLKWLEQENKI